MSAVIALCAAPDGAAQAAGLAAAVAQRLTGPVVVIPYDTVQSEWPRNAPDPAALASVTAQQIKLLCAGYVRAGYHIVLYGVALSDDGAALDTLLRLMATIPGVHPHRADVGGLVRADPNADLGAIAPSADLGAIADALLEQLPPGARDAR